MYVIVVNSCTEYFQEILLAFVKEMKNVFEYPFILGQRFRKRIKIQIKKNFYCNQLESAKIVGRHSLNDKGKHSRVFADQTLQMSGFQNAKNTVKGRYAVPRKSAYAL